MCESICLNIVMESDWRFYFIISIISLSLDTTASATNIIIASEEPVLAYSSNAS